MNDFMKRLLPPLSKFKLPSKCFTKKWGGFNNLDRTHRLRTRTYIYFSILKTEYILFLPNEMIFQQWKHYYYQALLFRSQVFTHLRKEIVFENRDVSQMTLGVTLINRMQIIRLGRYKKIWKFCDETVSGTPKSMRDQQGNRNSVPRSTGRLPVVSSASQSMPSLESDNSNSTSKFFFLLDSIAYDCLNCLFSEVHRARFEVRFKQIIWQCVWRYIMSFAHKRLLQE